ncbi:Paraquat-inducible protein A [Halioglobus japonicus]|nr:Paraquat-inducible protein A [Halioglobus japonicus]
MAINGEIACHSCDQLASVASLKAGESAYCPRCGHFLTRIVPDTYGRILSYTIAGIILLIMANSYTFLSFSSTGLESVITLRQTPGAVWEYGMPAVAIMVAAFIIIIPAFILVLLLLLCIPLHAGQYQPWLIPVAKMIFLTQNWSMVEVFIIGVIVSLVKIADMATVELGISFWAYAGFSICFTLAISSLDRYQCWEQIEALQTS